MGSVLIELRVVIVSLDLWHTLYESGVVENTAMPRFLLSPTFDIETGKLLSHDGEFFVDPAEVIFRFDRQAQGAAKSQRKVADTTGATAGSEAAGEGTTLRTQLTGEATHPAGYNPTDLNNMLVAQQEGAGGGNAAITGEGKLAALRQRNAGGIAPALAEAARSKQRTLATGGLDVANQNAMLKERQRQEGLSGLQGLYGTDTSNQLRAMGLSAEDLQNELAAGRQGWFQNTLAGINAVKGGTKSPAAYV